MNESKYTNTALAMLSTKEAALYFDYVSPFHISSELVLIDKDPDIDSNLILESILPQYMAESDECGKLWSEIEETLAIILSIDVTNKFIIKPQNNLVYQLDKKPVLLEKLKRQFAEFRKKYRIENYPLILPPNLFSKNDSEENVVVTISRLNLIDSKKLSWDKLLEFRKDNEARNKLRKLRLFANENYQDKEKAFIEDDLATRIYDYEQLVKEWEFETSRSLVSMFLSSKILGATISGSLISTYFGVDTLQAIFSISVSASIEIGNLFLEVTKKKHELRQILDTNPISYIKYINEKL
ncbi:MAG: hypothetical protein M1391_18695 [Bacteroidetes bacterium]|nr:hypothetical protein [Bacteroidota bacterium]